MRSLRILIADDHEILRRGVRASLAECPHWQICGEAANGREAVELALRLKPDVVVMDLTMPELNGLEATRQIRRALPRIEVLVLTAIESEEVVRQVLDAGASGYVLKNDVSRVVVQAVESLGEHQAYFTSRIATLLLKSHRTKGDARARDPGDSLTSREMEVLQLIAEGRSNKEAALALGISAKTAENHRTHLMRKLNVHSVTGLVRYAIRNGIIAP